MFWIFETIARIIRELENRLMYCNYKAICFGDKSLYLEQGS